MQVSRVRPSSFLSTVITVFFFLLLWHDTTTTIVVLGAILDPYHHECPSTCRGICNVDKQDCLFSAYKCVKLNSCHNVTSKCEKNGRCVAPCFAGDATVQVLIKGGGGSSSKQQEEEGTTTRIISMKNLKVGDQVLVGTNRYETVYAFGHRDRTSTMDYLEIQVETQKDNKQYTKKNPLIISQDHLMHVQGSKYIPAGYVKVGDQLDAKGNTTVTRIRTASHMGLYTPLTASGTIVVNDVMASCYTSFPERSSPNHPAYLQLAGLPQQRILLSHQFMMHFFLSPIRLLCLGILSRLCTEDSMMDRDTGYAHFSKFAWAFVGLLSQFENHHVIQLLFLLIAIVIVGPFWLLECLVGASLAPTILGFSFLAVAITRLMVHSKYRARNYIMLHLERKKIP